MWQGISENTRATYGSAQKHFMTFMSDNHVAHPLPASEDNVCLWLAHMSLAPLKYTSIKVYLSGLRSLHIDLGLPTVWKNSRKLERIYRAIKRVQGTADTIKPKLPITTELLRKFEDLGLLDDNIPEHRMLKAAMWSATTTLLRTGEFTADDTKRKPDSASRKTLRMRNWKIIQLDPPVAEIKLDESKTDPFRHGVELRMCHTLALKFMHDYLQRRKTPLTPDQPLFALDDGSPLTRKTLVAAVEVLLNRANVDFSKYGGFSFRRGGATSLRAAKVGEAMVKILGRWRGWSYARYIETSLPMIVSASALF